MIVTLGCGSSSVVVNTPASAFVEEASNSQLQEPTKEQQPKPTNTVQVGTVRSNPASVGSEVIADEMSFTVLAKVRPADDVVKAGNKFNSDPETGKEYMFVGLQVTCLKTTDEKCSLNPSFSMKAIGSKGVEYNA